MKLKNLKERTVLVTGASAGIGEEIAYRFAEAGSSLILTARRESELQRVAEKCLRLGAKKAIVKLCDMSQPQSIDELTGFMIDSSTLPDVLILNAGITQREKLFNTDIEVDKRLMEVNFFSNVRIIKNLKEHITSAKQINVAITTSISGVFGFPLRSAYASSKRALFGFFETLELEYPNVSSTFIIPGRINTDISYNAVTGNGQAYGKMDAGQAAAMSAYKCSKKAFRAIVNDRRKKLIGGFDLIMVHFYKFIPPLFYHLAKKVSAT